MSDGLQRYWFVAAVFREPHDLAGASEDLCANNFASSQQLVIANHKAEEARKTLDGNGLRSVRVLPVGPERALLDESANVPGLRALLNAMDISASAGDRNTGVSAGEDEHERQVYARLREDIAEGAQVLIASVANAEEQLFGARIMLRGKCECVLTLELAAPSA